ncbi:substrate-binding periplasmic protein [Dongshaea marina]|uniref:substrate-binding periplasmic protein n=1 Tax=Dongshaea marina TaxID=2047966 RepID=UPI000D3E6C1F|nr:transporter substrate-binding domain-containing protein [Dongshaea marina]
MGNHQRPGLSMKRASITASQSFPPLLTIALLFILLPQLSQASLVRICDDNAEWPPYTYYQRDAGKIDKEKLSGATVELMEEVFKEINLEFKIDLIPWKRCLKEVESFDVSKKYEVVINGSFNQQRHQFYYFSHPLYKTHSGIFYSAKKFSGRVPIHNVRDLNQYRLFGISGYNYSPFIEAGVTRKIHTPVKNNSQAFKLLEQNRYDFFLSSVEPVYGSHAIMEHPIPDSIKSALVPGIKSFTFYLMISKTSPRAYELSTRINHALVKLKENGTAEKIFKKYLPGGSGL